MELNIAVLPDDGVGGALASQGINVLQAVGEKLGHSFNSKEGLLGGVAIDTPGKDLSYERSWIISEYTRVEAQR